MGSEPAKNTDHEIWRQVPGDYYSPSIHVTQDGAIGINVGGHVVVAPVEALHACLCVRPPLECIDPDLDALLALDAKRMFAPQCRTWCSIHSDCAWCAGIVAAVNNLRPLIERCKRAEAAWTTITNGTMSLIAERDEKITDLTSQRDQLQERCKAAEEEAVALNSECEELTEQLTNNAMIHHQQVADLKERLQRAETACDIFTGQLAQVPELARQRDELLGKNELLLEQRKTLLETGAIDGRIKPARQGGEGK